MHFFSSSHATFKIDHVLGRKTHLFFSPSSIANLAPPLSVYMHIIIMFSSLQFLGGLTWKEFLVDGSHRAFPFLKSEKFSHVTLSDVSLF